MLYIFYSERNKNHTKDSSYSYYTSKKIYDWVMFCHHRKIYKIPNSPPAYASHALRHAFLKEDIENIGLLLK